MRAHRRTLHRPHRRRHRRAMRTAARSRSDRPQALGLARATGPVTRTARARATPITRALAPGSVSERAPDRVTRTARARAPRTIMGPTCSDATAESDPVPVLALDDPCGGRERRARPRGQAPVELPR